LIPLHTAFVDPTTGGFKAALTPDGTHPRNGTNRDVAQLAWDTISLHIPKGGPQLPTMHNDPNNLIPNGLFLGTTQGTAGNGGTLMPIGWTAAPSRDANTKAYIEAPVTDDHLVGKWFTIEGTAATAGEFRAITLDAAQIKPNHSYRLVFRFKTTGLRNANSGGGPTLLGRVVFNGVGTGDVNYDKRALGTLWYDTQGVAVLDFTAPSDAATAVFSWGITISTASTYKVRIGQLGVYDLTDMAASLAGAKHTVSPLDTTPTSPYLADNFNRADGAIGSTSTGAAAWTSAPSGFPFTISGNKAVQADATVPDSKIAYVADSHTDGIARAILVDKPTVLTGITVRGSTDGDGYVFYYNPASGGSYVLARRAFNSFTTLASKVQAGAAGDTLTLEVTGSTLVGKVNGLEVARATDTTHPSGTRVGLFTYGTGGTRSWDDWSWAPLS